MEDTTQRLQEAIAAARSGRLAEARGIAEELTESDPENAHAWFLRGILSEDEGQQHAFLSRTLELDPEHKAARKRLEQMQPAEEAEAEAEALAVVAETDEDQTMVADSEAFLTSAASADAAMAAEVFATTPGAADEAAEAAEEGLDEAVEETQEAMAETAEEAGAAIEASLEESVESVEEAVDESVEESFEDTFEDTMIAESPFAEEMAAEDLQVEALFGEAITDDDQADSEDEDEGLATVIAAAASLDEDEAAEEADQEPDELTVADLAAAAATEEAGEAWFEEEAGDDLWSKVEAEAVPDWLIEDTTDEAEAALAEESVEEPLPAAEGEITREQELPDWLLEETEDDWSEAIEAAEEFDEVPETVFSAATPVDEPFEDEAPAAPEADLPTPAVPKAKSSTRGLEILLFLLIIVALAIVVAIAYFLVYPPSF